jgi:hypothetical protein
MTEYDKPMLMAMYYRAFVLYLALGPLRSTPLDLYAPGLPTGWLLPCLDRVRRCHPPTAGFLHWHYDCPLAGNHWGGSVDGPQARWLLNRNAALLMCTLMCCREEEGSGGGRAGPAAPRNRGLVVLEGF